MDSEIQKKKPVISAMSSDTQALIDLGRSMEVGELLTYAVIQREVGFDVRKRRGPMRTALHRLLVDEGYHFDCVRTMRYRRLNNAEAAKTLARPIRRARAAARRGTRTAQKVDVLALPKDERATFVGRASLCGLMDDVSSAKSQRKLTELASEDTSKGLMSAKRALEALKGKKSEG